MHPDTGRKFGPYEIQARLGGGGMGHVFRAWDARLHREVAIKLLNHEYAMPGMRERFLREARAASALNHPNICTIFDIGEQDGDPYLVMELLQGETLKDRILNRSMSVDDMVCVAREVAEALGAAHAKGVVHRDIKPTNIFLVDKPNGGHQAKVLDFGLAKIDGGPLGARSRSAELTTAGATVGTLAYMSPEQARGEVLDSRSDLFSLGVVLYEMATRQVPFRGATSALVFVQLLNHAPDPVREWNESVPREFEKIVFKLLAKERTARFQTAREVELALLAVTEKASGGNWLRKAVSAVPLVRAPDPVARHKRLTRSSTSRPVPPSDSVGSNSPVPPRGESPRPVSEQVLRPVVRMPRGDASPQPGRNPSPSANGVATTFTPAPGVIPSRRVGDLAYRARTAAPRSDSAPSLPHTRNSALEASGEASQQAAQQASSLENVVAASDPLINAAAGPSGSQPAQPRSTISPLSLAWSDSPARRHDDPVPFERFLADKNSIRARPVGLSTRQRWILAVALAGIIGALLALYLRHGQLTPAILSSNDAVVVTEIDNQTGNQVFDQSVAEGLRIILAQSPWLTLRGAEAYRTARGQIVPDDTQVNETNNFVLARQTAERLRARAYISGVISGSNGIYTLHVELRDANSNEILSTADARADGIDQVPGAIDQVGNDLRFEAGEPSKSIKQASAPLVQEGSDNLAALKLLTQADILLSQRKPLPALADLRQAVALDPHFSIAWLRLARLYSGLAAESAAADAARLSLAAADHAGSRTRTLTQATFELETTGNFPRATALLRQLTAAYPHDYDALTLLAQSLVLQGRMIEALQTAQQAYAANPYDPAAYAQAERALIGLDRFDAAFQLEAEVQRLGMGRRSDLLTSAYLDGRQDVVDEISANIPLGKLEYRPDLDFGVYLDNAGHLAAGASLWRSRAEAAGRDDSLQSASSFLLSQGALDRALLGDCTGALALIPSSLGRTTLFRIGITAALCGQPARANDALSQLQRLYPQSFEVNAFFLADIRGALALHEGNPEAALAALEPARAFDLISLTPYLRGLAHVSHREFDLGIVDLETVLAHRGIAFIIGSDLVPAAQIAVGRAFAASGDASNSAAAYQRFLQLWRSADPLNPLVLEARKHTSIA